MLSSQINRAKTSSKAILCQASDKLDLITREFQNDPSQERASALKLQTRLVDQLHFEKAKQKLFFVKQRIFEQGERAGKLLAHLARQDMSPPVVITLLGPDSVTYSDPPTVAKAFQTYFMDLYSSKVQVTTQETQTFLKDIPFPQLSESQVTELEAPLNLDEIALAIASLAPAKAPGGDGLPLDFYAAYSEILIPELLLLFNHIFDTETLPDSLRQAVIIVIPKPGKDPHHLESYRPISLLQADIKILAKILSMRLNQSILSLINSDQTGFMPGMNTAMNLGRLYMNFFFF